MTTFAPTPEPEDWKMSAACRGVEPAVFFPDPGDSHERALAICRGCGVVAACLDFAMTNDQEGIWGGTGGRERDRIRRRTRSQRKAS